MMHDLRPESQWRNCHDMALILRMVQAQRYFCPKTFTKTKMLRADGDCQEYVAGTDRATQWQR